MKRRPLNLFTALSLLLCVAVGALWVRSFWSRDVLAWTDERGDGHVITNPGIAGGIEWSKRQVDSPARGGRRLTWHATPRDNTTAYVGIRPTRLGFGAERFTLFVSMTHASPGRATRQMDWTGVVVPHWALLLALGALPAARGATWAWRRHRARAAPGLCRQCGYDLRVAPGRCPECGAVAAGVTN